MTLPHRIRRSSWRPIESCRMLPSWWPLALASSTRLCGDTAGAAWPSTSSCWPWWCSGQSYWMGSWSSSPLRRWSSNCPGNQTVAGSFCGSLSIKLATMSAMSVLISAGAVLGKTNLVQLVLMALVEVTAFDVMRMIQRKYFLKDNHVNMMHIHVFAAYFGLMVAWRFRRPLHERVMEKDQTAKSSSLFGMLGTLFLWIFWPSFNSALLLDSPNERKNAMFNTYYALAVSAVTAISVSSLAHPQGKINMNHIHNAVLAGGVAVGASCYLISSPWLAMVLGLTAGLISTGGALCLPMYFNHVLGIHDTGGVYYTFGLPGLLGEIAHIVLITYQVDQTKTAMINHQLLLDIGALSLAMAMGLLIGLLTGLVLNLKIWRGPHVSKYFDDQAFWEFPHLAVGF
ncbi:RH-like protein isoform X2 [Panthera leo]|uniref:RH-like protein isoform X2 n=1 Tax=Panthera leo TaxID=9689 RepID=UPI001C699AA5|nr:RH-like protein isoform X2 [Panthera leo]